MVEEKTENICRLCLKVDGVAFSPLDVYCDERIKVVIPELIVDGTNFLICNKCKSSLEKSHALILTFDENDKVIRNKKNELKITDAVNLGKILNNSDAPEGKSTCRICLNSNEGNYTSLNEATADTSFNNVLTACLSGLDRTLTADPIICESCHKTLTDMHTLKTDCLSVEEKIKQYYESDAESKNLSVAQVLPLLRDTEKYDVDNDFLAAFEVRDEEGADIFDTIADLPTNLEGNANVGTAQWKSDNEPPKKRPAEASSNGRPPKKAKVNLEPTGDGLPHFKIHLQLLYDIKAGITLEEWLEIVDTEKKKNNWSDHITIQKVLMRLKEMPDLYTWFGSIGEILTWEEWKKKLIQAFPNNNDYCIRLKRLLGRKKRPTETFIEYYKGKMELIDSMNISGENAVSCLLGGLVLPNILASCIARIGSYKTPEEMLTYFKSCDEKQKVTERNKPVREFRVRPAEKSPVKPVDRGTPKVVERGSKPVENKNKVVVRSNEKTDKIVQGQSSRRKKAKCFKCFQRGHTAVECRRDYPVASLKPTSGPRTHQPGVRAPQGNVRINPKLPRQKPPPKCVRCGKVGHRTRTCPETKLAKMRQLQAENQNKSIIVYSAPVQCSLCNKANHTAYNCPQKKKKTPQSQSQQHKDRRNSSEQKCTFCGKLGHTVNDCRNKALQAKDNPPRRYKDPSEQKTYGDDSGRADPDYARDDRDREIRRQDKGSYKPSSNCYYCGSYGHDSTTCRQATRAGEESYFEDSIFKANSESQPYRQLLCFKCYKIGHAAEDCSRYPQRSYRD